MKDGLVIFYCKDDTLFPVILTSEQARVLEMLTNAIPKPIRVAFDQPQGTAVNFVVDET